MLGRLVFKTAVTVVVAAILLFGSAGTVSWPQAWILIAVFAVSSIAIGLLLLKRDPDLLVQRLGPLVQKEQPVWDKLIMGFLVVFILGWLVLMGLDAKRLGWSAMPVWLEVLGGVVYPVSLALTTRVLLENSFAATVVKLQADRDQRVIDSGPYAIVRHPMYATVLPSFFAIALMLGSWWGFAAALVFVAAIVARTSAEDRMLRNGLRDYVDYASRVRWRLVPGVW